LPWNWLAERNLEAWQRKLYEKRVRHGGSSTDPVGGVDHHSDYAFILPQKDGIRQASSFGWFGCRRRRYGCEGVDVPRIRGSEILDA
jgi:hypothetical protein